MTQTDLPSLGNSERKQNLKRDFKAEETQQKPPNPGRSRFAQQLVEPCQCWLHHVAAYQRGGLSLKSFSAA